MRCWHFGVWSWQARPPREACNCPIQISLKRSPNLTRKNDGASVFRAKVELLLFAAHTKELKCYPYLLRSNFAISNAQFGIINDSSVLRITVMLHCKKRQGNRQELIEFDNSVPHPQQKPEMDRGYTSLVSRRVDQDKWDH